MNTNHQNITNKPQFSSDIVAEDITSNISSIYNIIETSLQSVIEQSNVLFNDPHADPELVKEAGKRLTSLFEAGQLAAQSLKSVQAGIQLEQRIIEQAADDSIPVTEWKNKADQWVAESAEYFNRSEKQITQSAQLFSQDKGFFGFLDKIIPQKDPNAPLPAQAFWDKVNVAKFGIAVIASRVQHLPRVLNERFDQAIDSRVAAVSDTLEQWKHRSTAEYIELKANLKDVTLGIKQDFVDMKAKTLEISEKAVIAGSVISDMTDEFIANKIVEPVRNFISTFKSRIQSWSHSAYDILSEQKTSFNERFANKIEQRQKQEANIKQDTPNQPQI